MKAMLRWALPALASLLFAQNAPAADRADWTRPTSPFHIVGPIYYVGTKGIAVYLIRTPDGLILIDGGPEGVAPLVERSIGELGLKVGDVKLMLATHAHFDHAGALAALKRDSHAAFAASAADREAFDTGLPPGETLDGAGVPFPAVKVDRVLVEGVPVALGGIALTPIVTPGHTPGCTTWTMGIEQAGKPLRVVFPCSMSAGGNRLVGNRRYPGIVGDYRRMFAQMRSLPADIVLPAHPEIADVLGRGQRTAAGDNAAFIAPGLLPRLVDRAEVEFNQDVAAEQKTAGDQARQRTRRGTAKGTRR